MRGSAAARVFGCASVLLSYPGPDFPGDLAAVGRAVDELPPGAARTHLTATRSWLTSLAPAEVASVYVDTFDLGRRHALHLTYHTHGDTRERGLALADLAGAYREAGLVLAPGELPDHLPALLELAAVSKVGVAIVAAQRPSIELLRTGLEEAGSGFAGAMAAVVDTMGPASRAQRAALALLRASGPPTESVGLEPFGPPELVAPSLAGPAPVPVQLRPREPAR
ncbi:MAG TPA: nitrate reductase molybdenum cofactor assembly chaperone [Acidimicrobiales bacterium]|nr:nitrate reductase molybdenum cofactor assembly chaperone [Acidimicrobiales bacterium]